MASTGTDDAVTFVISVAAELAGMHPQTLRQYDRLGLVIPARTKGRGRRYTKRGRSGHATTARPAAVGSHVTANEWLRWLPHRVEPCARSCCARGRPDVGALGASGAAAFEGAQRH